MSNQQYRSSDLHAEPEYLNKIGPTNYPGLSVTEFTRGKCFICGNELEDKEAFVHLACAIAYEDKKKDNLKIFMANQKGVKSR
jgi:hypothetical protein